MDDIAEVRQGRTLQGAVKGGLRRVWTRDVNFPEDKVQENYQKIPGWPQDRRTGVVIKFGR